MSSGPLNCFDHVIAERVVSVCACARVFVSNRLGALGVFSYLLKVGIKGETHPITLSCGESLWLFRCFPATKWTEHSARRGRCGHRLL